MERGRFGIAAVALLAAGNAPFASAAPVQWSGNGHYYEIIQQTGTFADDKAYAEGLTYAGLPGYLVTITSAEENKFLSDTFGNSLIDPTFILIGAEQIAGSASDQGWSWVTGEPWVYTNWAPGEPNDALGDETIAHFYTGVGADGQYWADTMATLAPNFFFMVEYGRVPEPATLALFGLGLAGIPFVRRRRTPA